MERKAEQIPESPDPVAVYCLRLDDNLVSDFPGQSLLSEQNIQIPLRMVRPP